MWRLACEYYAMLMLRATSKHRLLACSWRKTTPDLGTSKRHTSLWSARRCALRARQTHLIVVVRIAFIVMVRAPPRHRVFTGPPVGGSAPVALGPGGRTSAEPRVTPTGDRRHRARHGCRRGASRRLCTIAYAKTNQRRNSRQPLSSGVATRPPHCRA